MTKITRLVACAISAASFCYAPSALSSDYTEYDTPMPWTHVASACAPDEAAIGKYAFNKADFSFKAGAYSDPSRLAPLPIVVRCNVANPMDGDIAPIWNTMIIGYSDPDGMAVDTKVSAYLYQVSRTTGATSIVASFDSNAWIQTTRGEVAVDLTKALNFHNNEYFVQLELTRTNNTKLNPVVYSARLVNRMKVPG
ncbi:MAG: hypothetical protein EPN97_01750 [Alphaproteobacteria bacterium]|nr:MAG: hypothetical protein EPN97_01750 [Alphaproteobacteria bacterium]